MGLAFGGEHLLRKEGRGIFGVVKEFDFEQPRFGGGQPDVNAIQPRSARDESLPGGMCRVNRGYGVGIEVLAGFRVGEGGTGGEGGEQERKQGKQVSARALLPVFSLHTCYLVSLSA